MEAPFPPEATASKTPVRILCAEDDPNVRLWLSTSLLRAGYAVTAAENGQQAWEALQSAAYDLLITDHQMPRLTGAELIARARYAGMALPIIVITGDLEAFARFDSGLFRIAALVQKPFGMGELSQALRQALRAGQ